jgi:hypothetical protein
MSPRTEEIGRSHVAQNGQVRAARPRYRGGIAMSVSAELAAAHPPPSGSSPRV